ncbi:MAG: beta-phosphoglucomutase, partial [Spirochaetes bacterium]|nr:beta-phosphoglucomutase [Spirochaetota bacterium]
LSPGQVKNILNIMGYKINDEIEFMKKNYEYYVKRTSHGSTLSHVVHSSILKYLHSHKNNMWEWFLSALKSDINDTQGGTTAEGIHSGVMAGTINIIVASFAGINLFKHYIKIEPNLPAAWEKLNFKILHSQNLIEFTITADSITVKYISGKDKKAAFLIGGTDYSIDINKSVTINY